jgi:hypothetical protein
MRLSAEELRKAKPRHFPATDGFRESWGIVNPHGHVIHFPSAQEARDNAALWADEIERQ